MDTGFRLSLYSRRSTLIAYIFTILATLLLPLIMALMKDSIHTSAKIEKYKAPKIDSQYKQILFSVGDEETHYNETLQTINEQHSLHLEGLFFNSDLDLTNFMLNNSQQSTLATITLNSSIIYITTIDQLPILNQHIQSSVSLFLSKYFLQLTQPLSFQPLPLHIQLNDEFIQMYSYCYFLIGIYQIAQISKLREKRRYEYLLAMGLNRLNFWIGIAIFQFLEIFVISAALSGIALFITQKAVSGAVQFFSCLLIVFAAAGFNVGFALFSVSVGQKQISIFLMYALCGVAGQLFVIVVYVVRVKYQKYLILGCQFIFPSSGSIAFITKYYSLLQNSSEFSFMKFLTHSDQAGFSLLVITIVSFLSLVFYVSIGLFIEKINKYATVPIQKTVKNKIPNQQQANQLIINNLFVDYKCRKKVKSAITNLSLNIALNNQIIGLIAENGAGKTTLFKAIMGSIRPVKGEVIFSGMNKLDFNHRYFQDLSFMFQENINFGNFTILQHLKLMSSIINPTKQQTEEILEMLQLTDLNRKITILSGGYQRRLNLAITLLKKADLYILDEPTCGIDLNSQKIITEAFKSLKKTMIISTHQLHDINTFCDDLIIMRSGKIILKKKVNDLQRIGFGWCIRTEKVIENTGWECEEFDKERKEIQQIGVEIRIPFEKEDEMASVMRQAGQFRLDEDGIETVFYA